jgi:excisionase family DNA binding protein
MAKRLRSVREAADELGVSKDYVHRLVKRGLIRAVRFGKRVLIGQAEIDRLVANGLQVAPTQNPRVTSIRRNRPTGASPQSEAKQV